MLKTKNKINLVNISKRVGNSTIQIRFINKFHNIFLLVRFISINLNINNIILKINIIHNLNPKYMDISNLWYLNNNRYHIKIDQTNNLIIKEKNKIWKIKTNLINFDNDILYLK